MIKFKRSLILLVNKSLKRWDFRPFHSDIIMPIDITQIRKEKGGDPDKIKESEVKRGKKTDHIDDLIKVDQEWRKGIIYIYIYIYSTIRIGAQAR